MNPKDPEEIKAFHILIKRAASKVARTVTAEIVDGYYDYLKDLPLDLIERAINHAYHDRDQEDRYIMTQIVSAIEIEQAASRIVEEQNRAERAKCPKCEGKKWIVEEKKDGPLVAHPCECLYNLASDALVAKGKSAWDRTNRRYWETIARSYEAYQKR